MEDDILGGFNADETEKYSSRRRAKFAASGSFDQLNRSRNKRDHSDTAVQLGAMMYKHIRLFMRNQKNLARDIIVPVVYMALLLLLFELVKAQSLAPSAPELIAAFFNNETVQDWVNAAGLFNSSHLEIAFARCAGSDVVCSDTIFDSFVSIFERHMNESMAVEAYLNGGSDFCTVEQLETPGSKDCLPPLRVTTYPDMDSLVASAMQKGNILFAAGFSVLPGTLNTQNLDVAYTIRTNHTIVSNVSTWLSTNETESLGAEQLTLQNIEKSTIWGPTGIVSFEGYVDRAIIAAYAAQNNIDMEGMANRSEVYVQGGGVSTQTKADLNVVSTLESMVPIYVTLVFALQVKTMLQHLLHEKESRIQIGLETMGLFPWVYHSSWILTGLLNAVPTIFVVMLASALGIFAHSNMFLLLIFFIMCSCACIAFAFFFTATFNNAHLGALIGFFIFFLSAVPEFALINDPNTSVVLAVAILFPPVSFNLGCNMLVQAENNILTSNYSDDPNAVAISFSNINEDTGFNFTFAQVLGLIAINCLVYGVAAWFLNVMIGCRNGRVHGRCRNVGRRQKSDQKPANRDEALQLAQQRTRQRVKSLAAERAKAKSTAFDQRRSRLLSSVLHTEQFPGDRPSQRRASVDNADEDAAGYEEHTLTCLGISKKFVGGIGSREYAVEDFSLEFRPATITVLLGQNGAGKTTTIRLLAGLLAPTEGEIRYGAQLVSSSAGANWRRVRARQGAQVGVCPEHDVFFDKLTVKEHLYLFASFKGLSRKECNSEVNRVIHQFGFEIKKDTMTRSLSQGSKRLLSVATALVGRPAVVLLDEPSSGMDLWSRRVVWSALEEAKSNGQVVIMTTLFTDEAEVLADTIAILHDGELAAKGSALQLKKLFAVGYALTLYPSLEAAPAYHEEFDLSGQADLPRFEMMGEALVRASFNPDAPSSSPGQAFVHNKNVYSASTRQLLGSPSSSSIQSRKSAVKGHNSNLPVVAESGENLPPPQLMRDLYDEVCARLEVGPDDGVTPPCFWDASRFRAARIQIQFPPHITSNIASLLDLISSESFREKFHVDEFVFSASSLEDIFLFLASTRLRPGSPMRPRSVVASSKSKATTLAQHVAAPRARRLTEDGDLLLPSPRSQREDSTMEYHQKLLAKQAALGGGSIQAGSRIMKHHSSRTQSVRFTKSSPRRQNRDKGLSKLFRIQGRRRSTAGSSSGSGAMAHRRRRQFCLLLGKRLILNVRNVWALLLVWVLAIGATALSTLFMLPTYTPVDSNINMTHDVTTASLTISGLNKSIVVWITDSSFTTNASIQRNASNLICDQFNEIANVDPYFPQAKFVEGGKAALIERLDAPSAVELATEIVIGGFLLKGLDDAQEFSNYTWPWSPRTALHLQVKALSEIEMIYNASLIPAQLMLINLLDSLQINLVVRANQTSSTANVLLNSTDNRKPLDIVTSYQTFPAQDNEKAPSDTIIDAQFLYVTLGMGPIFGTIAHHVLQEREHGFFLLQELCLLSPFSYWSSLFAADALILVAFPFTVSLVMQTLVDPCVFGGVLVGQYDITISLILLYVLSAASILSSVYLFTRIFRGHGEKANTALFLTLLLYTLGTVTFNAIFTVVDTLVSTESLALTVVNFIFYTIFPPYALYNGLVGLATYGSKSLRPVCNFPNNEFVKDPYLGSWPDMSTCLSALAVNIVWTYCLNVYLAYRAKGEAERKQLHTFRQSMKKQEMERARAQSNAGNDVAIDVDKDGVGALPKLPSGARRGLGRKDSRSRKLFAPEVRRRDSNASQHVNDVVDEILHLEDDSVRELRREVLHLYQRSYEEARRFDPHGYKQPSVTVLDLKKKFPLRGSKTKTLPAVNGVSLSFQAGETFGLLGPNGAGKTTMLRMLACALAPTSGVVMHQSNVVYADAKVTDSLTNQQFASDGDKTFIAAAIQLRAGGNAIRDNFLIGFCPQHDSIPGDLTGREGLLFFAGLRGIDPDEAEEKAEITAAKLGLLHCFDDRVSTWSPGDRRKLSVAIAFLGDPKLVLLDEPTTGLDPYARRKLLDFILQYQQLHCNPYQRQLHEGLRQPTIVFSTMSVRNAELLCSRMGIMQGGFFSCIGGPKDLRSRYTNGYVLSVKLREQGATGATAAYNNKMRQQKLLDFLQQGSLDFDETQPLFAAGGASRSDASVPIPTSRPGDSPRQSDFVDKSVAKFSVLSRSASAKLTYFVDRNNNTKDGESSTAGSSFKDGALQDNAACSSDSDSSVARHEFNNRQDTLLKAARTAAAAKKRKEALREAADGEAALEPHELFETELMVGRGCNLKFKLTHLDDIDGEGDNDEDPLDVGSPGAMSPTGSMRSVDASLVASHVAELDSIDDADIRRRKARSLGRARARAALAAAQAKQNKRIKALFALIEMLEMHKDALQIESYEVLPYGLQQLFLTCAKMQAKLERARRGSMVAINP